MDTRRRFNVYKTSIWRQRRRIDVETTSSVYWDPGILSYSSDSEAVAQMCSVKKLFLEISQNSQENICLRVSFLIKLQAETCNLLKKDTLTQVFSCEFWEISKNNLRQYHLLAASDYHKLWDKKNLRRG